MYYIFWSAKILTGLKTEAKFESFYYCHLWKVQFLLFSIFLAFFIWSANCSGQFCSYLFCCSVSCMGWVLDFGMSRSLIYIWNFLVLLLMKSFIHTICTFSDFFLVCKLYKSGMQIISLISDLNLWAVLILEICSSETWNQVLPMSTKVVYQKNMNFGQHYGH